MTDLSPERTREHSRRYHAASMRALLAREASRYVAELGVSADDLELWDHLSAMDLTCPAVQAFVRLRLSDFQLGDRRSDESYYQATHDHVADAVERLGLLKEG